MEPFHTNEDMVSGLRNIFSDDLDYNYNQNAIERVLGAFACVDRASVSS